MTWRRGIGGEKGNRFRVPLWNILKKEEKTMITDCESIRLWLRRRLGIFVPILLADTKFSHITFLFSKLFLFLTMRRTVMSNYSTTPRSSSTF